MKSLQKAGDILDIVGQPETNVGNMFQIFGKIWRKFPGKRKRRSGHRSSGSRYHGAGGNIRLSGGETCMEKAVGIAAMVKTHHLPMEQIAEKLEEELHLKGKVAGVEAVMASLGALTTPGTQLPLAILDMAAVLQMQLCWMQMEQ